MPDKLVWNLASNPKPTCFSKRKLTIRTGSSVFMTAHARNAPDQAIDALLNKHIEQGDFPSAVYLVAEAGEVVCANALCDAVRVPERQPARLDTIYDLASLTKPLVTTLLVAQQIQQGKLALETRITEHLSEFRRTKVERITLRELLTHTSGLPAWRPLYARTEPDAKSVLTFIASCGFDYTPGARVVYSDLGFITLGFLLERLTGMKLADLARQTIFEPLNLQRTFFNPPPSLRTEIAASETGNAYEREMCRSAHGIEESTDVREGIIWGEVHDGNAYFLGGAAGHAGLFSNATETMLLGEQFIASRTRLLSSETRALFQTNMTEGLNEARSAGWQLAATPDSTAGERLPPRAFGHLGFAGTSLWVDAERERIFILLTNRTHDRPLPFVNINSVRRRFHTLAVERLEAKA